MHGRRLGRIASQPRLLGREAHQRSQPQAGAAEDLLDGLQRRLALDGRDRLAVERILADVEVERRQVGVHELRQQRHHALVVVLGVGLADLPVELGQPVQHQPLQLRHHLHGHRLLGVVVGQRAEHPAQRVPELAVGLDRALDDAGPETDVARVVRGRHPQAQDVGAGVLHDVLRRHGVALGLRHLLLALLVEDEAVRQHHVERRPRPRAAALQQRGLEPAAMLVGAFQVHDAVLAAVAQAADAGEARKLLGVLQREGMRGA